MQFINNQREVGEPELRHDHFMAKVPKVLGEEGVPKFRDTYTNPQNGQSYPCYRLPKREACLMAMSYSLFHFEVTLISIEGDFVGIEPSQSHAWVAKDNKGRSGDLG